MRRGRDLFAVSILTLAVLGLLACEGTTEEEDQAAAQAEAFAQLQQAKAELDAKRQELAEARAVAAEGEAEGGEAGGDEGGGEGGEEGEASESEAEPTSLEALEKEVIEMGEAFTSQLAEFINSQEIYEGEPLTEQQRAAFDMKADEDILVAKEYITKGGNYQKAIDIYVSALLADPTNEKLLAAKAEAEELRFMTEERFAQVKKGMSEDEVRALLGTPRPSNVREFDKGVVGWFYPKEEPRSAAGVYYRKKRGELAVYEADFNAIESEDVEQ